MGKLTNYTTGQWLNHVLEGTAFTKPAALWFAYSTTDFTAAGTGGTEPVGNNYSRTTCLAKFATGAASRIVSNDADIVCAQASGSQGTIGYWAIFDNSSGGNCLCYGSFAVAKAVGANQTLKVLTGEIDISIPASNGMTTYLANAMLTHTFVSGGSTFTQPTCYLALSAGTNFGDAGAFTNEVSTVGTAYARIATAWTLSGSPLAATNNGALTFTVATASWGTVNGYAITDGDVEGGGNMLLYGDWTGQAIAADDQVNIPSGDLDITFTG